MAYIMLGTQPGDRAQGDLRMCLFNTLFNIKEEVGTSLVVKWLRLCTPKAGGLGSIPGQGTRSHMLQLRFHMLQLKILCAPTKTWSSQINK